MNTTEVLGSCKLFACLREEQLQRLLPLCSRRNAQEGDLLFSQGQPARHLYVVAEGRAALDLVVQRHDGYGYSNPATVAIEGPGEAFGWSAIVEPHKMTLSARSIGPSSFILVDGPCLKELLQRHKDIGFPFMTALSQLLAERLIQTREALLYERGLAIRV